MSENEKEISIDNLFFFSQSNSSIDSIDQLPFANDNAGTIKQRVNQYSQMTHSSPNVSYKDNELVTKSSNQTDAKLQSSIVSADASQIDLSTNDSTLDKNDDGGHPTSTATTIDSNVLNDIGNMLANLTDELDAMLEEEKRAGLNDSE